MRFDPELRLPADREFWNWRPATWPATASSWRVRRAIGRPIDGLARMVSGAGTAILRFADFVHGQPQVSVRMNLAALGPRRVNRFVERNVTFPRAPFAAADLAFLADHSRRVPATLDALDDELREAVLAEQARAA